jgi:ferredoxin
MVSELTADRDVCIGSGQCVRTAPDLFDSADDGLVEIRRQPEPAELDDAVDAVRLCPSRALRLVSSSAQRR